jgi:hypothetical protein
MKKYTHVNLISLLYDAIEASDRMYGHAGIDTAEGDEDWLAILARVQNLADDLEIYRTGWRRYEIARRLNPQQWAECWLFSMEKGAPFDAVIDAQAETVGVK